MIHTGPSRRVRIWTAAIASSIAITLCAPDGVRAGRLPRSGGRVNVLASDVPHEVTPTALHGEVGTQIASCAFEGLTQLGSRGVEPNLAVRWFHSDDNRRWVFELRRDVQFHDGTPLDAQAVVASVSHLASQGKRFDWLFGDLEGWTAFRDGSRAEIDGLVVHGAHELEFVFTRPVTDLPVRLALRPAAVARWSNVAALGTGPFRLAGVLDASLRLVAFESHHLGRPFLDEIDFVQRAGTTNPQELGKLSVGLVGPDASPGNDANLVRSPAQRLGAALVRPRSTAFQDLAVRQRLSTTFDRNVFVRATLAGNGAPAFGLSPERPATIPPEDTSGDLLHRPRERVRVVVPDFEPVLRQLGARLQVHLFALGFDASLDVLAPDEFAVVLLGEQYDIALLGWTLPQRQSAKLQETTLVRWILHDLLQPVLSQSMPEAWQQILDGTGQATEARLLESHHLLPLVFYHDTWQVSAALDNVDAGVGGALLGLDAVHVEPGTE
jgi:MarR-like DNA-binding transcriptional regulator SgrR of sgrS sRNA